MKNAKILLLATLTKSSKSRRLLPFGDCPGTGPRESGRFLLRYRCLRAMDGSYKDSFRLEKNDQKVKQTKID